jgi:4'-phosphopantetheinyl transferase
MTNSREVDVWLISCETTNGCDAYGILQEAEKKRADAFLFPEHRRRFIQAHAALRQILHHYTGVAPGSLLFASGDSGKPCLENMGTVRLSFNMSHSGELAAVAVSGVTEIGVDIESIRPMPDWEQIARQSFHPAELEWLRATAAHRRNEAFFEVWTAKEAYIKASGRGLSHPLDSFAVVGAAPGQDQVISRLELPKGYVGAVAHSPPECEINLRWWGSN